MPFLRKYVGDKMGEIKIVKSAVHKEGQNMCENGAKIMDINNRLLAILDGLARSWQGEDSERLIAQMRELFVPSMELLGLRVDAYGKYLQGIKNPYDHLDSSFGKKKRKN